MKPKAAGGIAPPQRGDTTAKVFTQEKSVEDVRFTATLPAEEGRYLRMLAAQTGRGRKDLLTEAINLLREIHGDM